MAFLTHPGETHGAVNDVLSPAQWYWTHLRFPRSGPLPGLSAANSSAYFTAVFKRLTGSNPQEYRKHVLTSDRLSLQDSLRKRGSR